MVAGGAGRRFGEPKQFLQLAGQPVAVWSVAAARAVADGVVLVVPGRSVGQASGGQPRDGERATTALEVPETGADRVVAGGATRAESVRAGLAAVPDDAGIIVVHDAARPLATSSLFAAVVEAVRSEGVDGAIPVLPVADTLKRAVGETVQSTVDRDGLVAVQTPQAFAAAALRSAHRWAGEATDDAALLENMGATVRTVAGEPHNVKLTRPEDLVLAEALMADEGDRPVRGGSPSLRIGQGLDVHRFSDDPGRPLILGGVVITGSDVRGLDGHSDADAVAHAIADAVLGAAGLGDIGRHAPDSDPRWRGADSMEILARMADLARSAGWSVVNADCTVVAERPRLAPFVGQISRRLAAVLGGPVNVKATTAEGLGPLGRAEGIACNAIVLMSSEGHAETDRAGRG